MQKLKLIRQILAAGVFLAFILMFARFDTFGNLAGLPGSLQLGPALLQHAGWAAAAFSIGIILFTMIAGRVYCSILCPLGLLQDLVLRIKRLFARVSYRPMPALGKLHFGLAGLLIGAGFAGFMLPLAIFEPFAVAGRIFTALFQPLTTMIFKFAGSFAGSGVNWLGQAAIKPSALQNTILVAATALLLAFICLKWGRVYCNSICPVGAILRLAAGRSLLKVSLDREKCVSCGLCANICKAGCIDTKDKSVDNSRCVACFNCLDTCRFEALTYQGASKTEPAFSAGRRNFAAGMAAAAAGYLVPGALLAKESAPNSILPPGAGNHERFYSTCISCHLCVTACPSSVIRPSSPEQSLLSLQQPSLNFDLGMCEQNCNLCSQVCPVMAIKPVTPEDKKLLKIGEVVYKKHLCVVVTNQTDCGACAEHCPTQAVRMIPYQNNLMNLCFNLFKAN